MAGEVARGGGQVWHGIPVRGPARERILDTAYQLFSRNGIRSVGIDRIIAEAGVAKATLYHHFPSKEDLAVAFLQLREQRWTREWLQAEVERLAIVPRERALIVFELYDEWFHRPGYEGCSFINTLLEYHDEADPIRCEAARRLAEVRELVEGYAAQAGAADAEQTGMQLHILMMGSTVSAALGDLEAARRAQRVASVLLESSR
ncbi:MAG: TetR/AcrR family transcriptional regulator [Solirubrobacteraceae bacterium]